MTHSHTLNCLTSLVVFQHPYLSIEGLYLDPPRIPSPPRDLLIRPTYASLARYYLRGMISVRALPIRQRVGTGTREVWPLPPPHRNEAGQRMPVPRGRQERTTHRIKCGHNCKVRKQAKRGPRAKSLTIAVLLDNERGMEAAGKI